MRVIAVPRELKPTSPAFLRGHYSTGVREAAAMAVYAASVGSDPRVAQNGGRPRWGRARRLSRTRPAGLPSQPNTDQAKPPDAQAAATVWIARSA